ncbi:hypothetical protein CEN44_07545 [Fischerella muscicola CCMEE 5323]|uniref:Protein kinase domain-containing protein n=1 Tax=Fischerella muscicola CCMEE 5323 TaxID=2019572 RepID=A0A2N6K5K0_FISMU|nr:protein kinase [Fischerella muscicola]PLZ91859.1 hypothetical protein CEN44_07545 [Fischerella muscicola CCMEE 5323]
MIYCINPYCTNRQNPYNANYCQTCGTSLLIKDQYRLVRPLRPLSDPFNGFNIEVFEVVNNQGTLKVLKVLRSNDRTLRRLFVREAEVLTSLRNHQGVPQVESEGYFRFQLPKNGQFPHNRRELHCLLMEKIEGQDLEQWLRENEAISQDLALDWLRQLAQILHEIHHRNLFHRDIKPANIMLRPNGKLVLIDFGAARWVTQTIVNGGRNTEVYTYGYAAPEQMDGNACLQSDFFALGRTFVHLLTGQRPNDLPKYPQTNQLNWRRSAPQISESLANFIDELMAPSVEARPRDTQALLQRLDIINPPDTTTENGPQPNPTSRSRVIVGAIAGFIIILLLSVWIWDYIKPGTTCSPALDVSEMAFSPDGRYLATVSLDNTLRVLKPNNNKLIYCKSPYHKDGIVALKFSPDGKKFATASLSLENNAALWKMNADGSISFLRPFEHRNFVVALTFSPNKGKYLATATAGGSVRVWDTGNFQQSNSEVRSKQYDGYVTAVDFSLDEKYLAIVGRNNKGLIWEWQTNTDKKLLNDVVAVAFSPKDAKYLATADAKGYIKVLDTNNFNNVNTVDLKAYPTAISFSPEGKHLLILGADKKAKLWEWEKQDETITLEHDPQDKVVAFAFSSNSGRFLATANTNGTINVWDNNGTWKKNLSDNNSNSIVAIAFNPQDEKQLAVASADGSVKLIKWSSFIFGSWVF